MDKLKDPGTIISSTTAVGLIGASIYFYRKIDKLETEMEKLNERMASIIRTTEKLTKTPEQIDQLVEGLKTTNAEKDEIRKSIEDSNEEDKEKIQEYFEVIGEALKQLGVEIEDFDFEPVKKKGKKGKKGKKEKASEKSESKSSKSRRRREPESDSDSSSDDEKTLSELRRRR